MGNLKNRGNFPDCYETMRDTESVDLTIKMLEANGTVIHHTVAVGIELGDIYWDYQVKNGEKVFAQKAEELNYSRL